MEYTLGPWALTPDNCAGGEPDLLVYQESKLYVGVQAIAMVYVDNKRDKANAHLIMAAPEMYESLKLMTALVRLKYGNLDKDIYKEIEKAEALIAKVEDI